MENYLEYTAVVFGVIYVALAARNNAWCWLSGIISSALYIYINIANHFFQDAVLQTYYVIIGFYGWRVWTKEQNLEVGFFVRSFTLNQNLKWIVGALFLVPFVGYFFSQLGNSLPYFDSAVTIFSFLATWMTARKILESWLLWIAIDALATAMYFMKGLHATAGLYVFYAVVAIYGYWQWKKKLTAE